MRCLTADDSIVRPLKKISREMISMLSTWRHSGFHVCRGTMRIISSIEDQDVIKTILHIIQNAEKNVASRADACLK
jgi:hypothetical protein